MAFDVSFIYKLQDQISGKLKEISRKFKDVEGAGKKAAFGTSKAFKKLTKDLKGFGTTLRNRVTLPLLAVGGVSVVAFARMETGLVNINNLLSRSELDKFGNDLERMQEQAVKAGFSIEDSNKGLFDTISALGASKEAFKAFSVAQKLAIGGNTNLAVAVDGLTSIMNVYGKETTDATEVANAFFSSQVKGKTTVAQLASAVGQVAPIANAAGVSFKPLLAAMSALTTGGLSTDEAATSLKGAFTALIKPTGDAAKILKSMNIPFGAASIKAKGLSTILTALTKAQEKYGTDAIAKAIPNIRAFTAVTALSADKIALLDDVIKKINVDMKTGDGLTRAYADQQKTLALRFAKTRGELTIASKKIADVLKPALIKIMEIITKLANKFANLSPRTRKFIIALVGIAVVLGPLLILLAVAGAAVTALGAPFVIVSAAVSGLIALLVTFSDKLALLKNFAPIKAIMHLGSKMFGGDKDINQNLNLNKNINSSSEFNGNLQVDVKAPTGTSTYLDILKNTSGFNTGISSIISGAR